MEEDLNEDKFIWKIEHIQITKKKTKSFEDNLFEHLTVLGEKYNSCHLPKGPGGGQFCSAGSMGGFGGGGSETVSVPNKPTSKPSSSAAGTNSFEPGSHDELNKHYNLSENCG